MKLKLKIDNDHTQKIWDGILCAQQEVANWPAWKCGEDTTSSNQDKVDNMIYNKSIQEIQFPNKKYNIIYADPPWHYKDSASAGKRGACFKYPIQTDTWIKNLPLHTISAENCILFIWCTMPKLDIIFDVIKSWGFTYKTVAFTWVKRNKKANTWFFGMGNWTRSNAEICLLAVKGKPKRINASISSIIDTPIEEHSQKPAIVRDKIVELCGDIPRIELFARQKTEGWDVWGNEI